MQKTIGIIPSRFDSSRFPGKPLADIAGKTLIQRTYENACRCPVLDEIYIATDNKKIYDHTVSFGAKTVMTSPACPTGTDRIVEALESIDLSDEAIVLNIQGDSPLLEPTVLESVALHLQSRPLDVCSTAACPIRDEKEAKSPDVVKCVLDKSHYAMYFSRSIIPYSAFERGRLYHHLGIYGYRLEFLRHFATLRETPLQMAEDLEQLKILEHGFRIKVSIVESSSFGVDKPEDVEKVKRVLCQ